MRNSARSWRNLSSDEASLSADGDGVRFDQRRPQRLDLLAKPDRLGGGGGRVERTRHEAAEDIGEDGAQGERRANHRGRKELAPPAGRLDVGHRHRGGDQPPGNLRADGGSQDLIAGNIGRAEHTLGLPALLQQLRGKGLPDKVGMPLRPREDDPVVVGDAGDPVRLKSLTLQQVFKTRCVKRHDEDVAHRVTLNDGNLDVDERLPRDQTDDQIGDLTLPGVEHLLRCLGIRSEGQLGAEWGPRIEELLIVSVNEQDARLVAPERANSLLVEHREVSACERRCRPQGLKSYCCAVQLPVDVACEVFRNLQDAPLDLNLFETGHAIEGEDRKTQ